MRGWLFLLGAVVAAVLGGLFVGQCASRQEEEATRVALEGVWTFQLADAVSDAQTYYATWRPDKTRWEKVQSSIDTLRGYQETPYEIWFDRSHAAAYRQLVSGEKWTMGTWKVGARKGEIQLNLQKSTNRNVADRHFFEWHDGRLFVHAGSLFFPLRHSEAGPLR